MVNAKLFVSLQSISKNPFILMNLYLRFFNDEVLVETVDQAIEFLSQIPEIKVDDTLRAELVSYVEGTMPYPRRFKVHHKSYFIVIKTTATTLEEFKSYAGVAEGLAEEREAEKEAVSRRLTEENPGWYEATMLFKRVASVPDTNKFCYVDTEFVAKLKANSILDCYNRMVDHLRNRADVDQRSQFPSVKGRNFKAEFLGNC